MSLIDRRRFVGTLAVLPAGATLAARETRDRLVASFVDQNDRELLVAVASTVLPGELGADGWNRAAEQFERWVAAFKPGAELNHGYGTDELRQAGPDPWPRWQQQLRSLDGESGRRFHASFVRATPEQRRVLVEAALNESGAQRLPQPQDAEHVALGLLGWFCVSSEATDLCYSARIGRESCRTLDGVTDPPRPL